MIPFCFQHTACILHFLPPPNLSQLLSCLGHCDGPYLISLLPLWSHDLLSTHQPIMNVLSMTFLPPPPMAPTMLRNRAKSFYPYPNLSLPMTTLPLGTVTSLYFLQQTTFIYVVHPLHTGAFFPSLSFGVLLMKAPGASLVGPNPIQFFSLLAAMGSLAISSL